MNVGRPKQSIHKVFAENLRIHCGRFDSIAELCRLAQINRQQFNRYLSGQNLPNPRTLERLSVVLEVSEASLFESRSSARSDSGSNISVTLKTLGLTTLLQQFGVLKEGAPTDLRTGYYYCYAPLIDHPTFCIRMLIHVVNDGKLARFTRRTSFKHTGSHQPELEVGRHSGIILGDVNGALLVGRNRIFPHEFSAFRVQRPPASPDLPRAGVALLRNSVTDIGSRIALHYMGDGRSAARKVLAQLGVTEIEHESVPHVVRAILLSSLPQAGDRAINYILAERDVSLTSFKSPVDNRSDKS